MSRIIAARLGEPGTKATELRVGWDNPLYTLWWCEFDVDEEINVRGSDMRKRCHDIDELVRSMPRELRQFMTPDVRTKLYGHMDDGSTEFIDMTKESK